MSAKAKAQAPPPEQIAAELQRIDRRRVFSACAWIFAVALALRLIHLLQAREVPLFDILIVDGRQYEAWARRIAAGDWLGQETFYQAPLYPYFLALLKVCFGDGLWPVRIVQALLGAASCALLFLAGRNFVSHQVGVVAGALLAVYPPAIFFDGIVQKASVGGFIVVVVLWLLSRAQKAPNTSRFAALGVALGLLMLTREETILLVPALLAWIVVYFWNRSWSMRGLAAGAFVGGLALVLLPIGFRNYKVGGEFLITTSQAGTNFWIGNRPGADGRYAPLRPGRSDTSFERKDAVELAEIEMQRKLTSGEVSEFWRGQALAWISDEPLAWLELLARKTALLVNAYEVPDAEDQYFYEKHEPVMGLLSRFMHLGIVLPLCAAGLVLSASRRRELGVLALLLAVLCAGVVLFYVMGRYRYPIVPIAIVFAALALVQGWALMKVGAWKALLPAGIALVAMGIVSNWPIYGRDSQFAMSHVNAGAALASVDRIDEAIAQYKAALALDPDMPEGWSNLGVVYGRTGRMQEAVACFTRAVELRADDPRFRMRLGTALHMSGQTDRAVIELARSTELFPQDPEAWNNLRFIHVQRRDWSRAVDVARRGVAANPQDLGLNLALAWLLATCPDERLSAPDEAVRIATECVRATGGAYADPINALAAALARAGRFKDAHAQALEAVRIAERNGQNDQAAEIRARAELYAQDKPCIEGLP
ncbi:MAG: tetratricopeptide repeat protein [Planctomycetes bacterium]|nr:tetratricopeptide repeat protein [Planctomycetota bacterium]